MMIGPAMACGLEVTLEGQPVSFSYIQMTAAMMKTCGADVAITGNKIIVKDKPYQREHPFEVEADWSAASYWYGMLALAEEGWITLPGLHKDSLQGDHLLSEWMVPFGVLTEFGEKGVTLRKTVSEPVNFDKDFTLVPDLAQTFLVVLAAKGYKGELSGLKTLRIKETDRLEAMKAELQKCGVELRISEDRATIKPGKLHAPDLPVRTYHDHRMAMAFAMLAVKTKALEIQSPEVVSKSYPAFWEELEKVGMEINS
jgi:3-phosphoshikimate 1-carboxyvinyltransferase